MRRSAADANEDALLTEFLEWATSFIDWYKNRRFDVRRDTLSFDIPESSIQRAMGNYDQFSNIAILQSQKQKPLVLDEDLLEVVEFLNGSTEAIDWYVLNPGRTFPKSSIRLTNGVFWIESEVNGVYQAIDITGFWGYVPDYNSEAFVDSLNVINDNPLLIGAITMNVNDFSGAAADGKSPRFQVGQLLRFKLGAVVEFVKVLSIVDGATDTIGIQRGVNGTTAVQWAQNTKIEIFRVWGPIHQSALRLAQWRYAQKDSNSFDKTYMLGAGMMSIPPAIPTDVLASLGARGKARVL